MNLSCTSIMELSPNRDERCSVSINIQGERSHGTVTHCQCRFFITPTLKILVHDINFLMYSVFLMCHILLTLDVNLFYNYM